MDEKKIAEMLDGIVSKIVDRKLKQYGILQGYMEAGKIVSVSGNRASVKINGSSETTTNIPIANGLTLIANDEVWIMKINFNNIDKIIWCKRPI